jgi:adenosylhomocysteine nucleosidase
MTRSNRIIGIIGSMDTEIQEYLKEATNRRTIHWNNFLFNKAQLFGKDVVIVKCGVGKVFAAMVCERLIDEYAPKAIILTGVAGALNKKLEIGDVVISRDCIQYDMDVEALGFSRGTIPYTNYRVFVADAKLRGLALSAKIERNQIMEGRILTGDQFLTKKEAADHRYLTQELKGDAVEMEGGAIAQVCTLNKIPFLIVRTVSDKADGTALKDFSKFLPVVAQNSFDIVKTILYSL